MANVIPVKNPTLRSPAQNMAIQKPVLAEAATQTWLLNQLVKISSGALARVATADVLCYGLSPDGSHASTDRPPVAFNGQNHWPYDLTNAILEVSVTTTGGPVGSTATGAVISAMTIGEKYGIYTETTGGANLAPIATQMLNLSDTTNDFFEYLGAVDGTLTTDINPRVLVRLLPAVIQN